MSFHAKTEYAKIAFISKKDMTQNRQAHEHLVQQMRLLMKLYRFISWLLVVAGVLLMLTVIGIPLGFICLLISGVMFWGRKRVQAKIDLGMAAHLEQVEVFEANLARARKEQEGMQP